MLTKIKTNKQTNPVMLTKQINKLQNNGTPTDAEVSRLSVPGLARFCCVHRGPVYTLYLCRSMVHRTLCPHLHTHSPPFSPSLIGLMVAVDVKHHVDWVRRPFPGGLWLSGAFVSWCHRVSVGTLCKSAQKSLCYCNRVTVSSLCNLFLNATEWLWALYTRGCKVSLLLQLSDCEYFVQSLS